MRPEAEELQSATVVAELPQRLFRLSIEDGTIIIAGLSSEAKRLGLALCVGSQVQVRRANLDPGRGTIIQVLPPTLGPSRP